MGYCSVPCRDARPRKNKKEVFDVESPASVLLEMRDHLSKVHQAADVTAWFPDCKRCEGLNQRYAAALREVA